MATRLNQTREKGLRARIKKVRNKNRRRAYKSKSRVRKKRP